MFPVVNASNFDEHVLNAKGIVLVNVWADWCEECWKMSNIMSKVYTFIDEQDAIVQIDWDQQKKLTNKLEVYGVPTLLIYANGDEVARYSGMVNKGDLFMKLAKVKNRK